MVIWFRRKELKRARKSAESILTSLKGSPHFSGFSEHNKNLYAWEDELRQARERMRLILQQYGEVHTEYQKKLDELHAEFLVSTLDGAKREMERFAWYPKALEYTNEMHEEMGRMFAHANQSKQLKTEYGNAGKTLDSNDRRTYAEMTDLLKRVEEKVRHISRNVDDFARQDVRSVITEFGKLADFAFSTTTFGAYDIGEFLLHYVKFHGIYFDYIFKWIVHEEARNMLERSIEKPSAKILQKHETVIDRLGRKMRARIKHVKGILPREFSDRTKRAEENASEILRKFGEDDARNDMLTVYGGNLLTRGYEEGNQKDIERGAQFYFREHSKPRPLPMSTSSGMRFVHGISPGTHDDAGSWESTGMYEDVVSPEAYAERISSVLREGLRPSERQDSQFHGNPRLSRMKEVWFFYHKYVRRSYYGIVNLVFEPRSEYVVFEGIMSEGKREFFILTKTPIPGPFRVILVASATAPDYLRTRNGKRMAIREYIDATRQELVKRGITFDEV